MLSNGVNQKWRNWNEKVFLTSKRRAKEDKKTCACDVNLSNNSYKSDSTMKEHILQTVFLSAQVYRGTKPYLSVDAMYYLYFC